MLLFELICCIFVLLGLWFRNSNRTFKLSLLTTGLGSLLFILYALLTQQYFIAITNSIALVICIHGYIKNFRRG